MNRVIAELNQLQPDVVVVSGDLTTDGFRPEYKAWLAYADRIEAPLLTVPGNHDSRNVGYLHFEDLIGPRMWVHDIDNVRIVGVDVVDVVPHIRGPIRILEVEVADIPRVVVARDREQRSLDPVGVREPGLVLGPEPIGREVAGDDDHVRLELVQLGDHPVHEVGHEVRGSDVRVRDVGDRDHALTLPTLPPAVRCERHSVAADLDLEPPSTDPRAQDPPRRADTHRLERERRPVRSLEHHERRTGPRDAHRDVVAAERRDHVRDLGHRREPNVLVEAVDEGPGQERRVPRQRVHLDSRPPDVRDGVRPRDALGQNAPRRRGGRPQIGHEESGRRSGCGSSRCTEPSSSAIVNHRTPPRPRCRDGPRSPQPTRTPRPGRRRSPGRAGPTPRPRRRPSPRRTSRGLAEWDQVPAAASERGEWE